MNPGARRYNFEKGYIEAFAKYREKFAAEISKVSAKGCLEWSYAGFCIAYNPHKENTFTSHGQRLDPETIYVEENGQPIAMLQEDGGMTLHGIDNHHARLKQQFEALTPQQINEGIRK